MTKIKQRTCRLNEETLDLVMKIIGKKEITDSVRISDGIIRMLQENKDKDLLSRRLYFNEEELFDFIKMNSKVTSLVVSVCLNEELFDNLQEQRMKYNLSVSSYIAYSFFALYFTKKADRVYSTSIKDSLIIFNHRKIKKQSINPYLEKNVLNSIPNYDFEDMYFNRLIYSSFWLAKMKGNSLYDDFYARNVGTKQKKMIKLHFDPEIEKATGIKFISADHITRDNVLSGALNFTQKNLICKGLMN